MSSIIIPKNLPTPEEDSEKLKKAFHGLGTDEDAVIDILGHRNSKQRIEIANAYHRLYNESLIDRLQSELTGNFKKAVILWVLDPAERDAKLANKALKTLEKGKMRLLPIIEVACASSSDHLVAVREAYCSLFKYSLEEDIELHLVHQPSLRQLLVGLVSTNRSDGNDVDEVSAKFDAHKLQDALENKQSHHEEVIRILSMRSNSQLTATFTRYKQEYGKTIDEDIESNKSGDKDLALLLKAAVLCIESPEKHFAEVVRSSVVGLGTDESSLTRVIITRAEIDMKRIKMEYKRYGTSINDDIKDDTSRYYKHFLLTLVGWAAL